MSDHSPSRLDALAALWLAPPEERMQAIDFMADVLSKAEVLLRLCVDGGVCPECEGVGYNVEVDGGGHATQVGCHWCSDVAWLMDGRNELAKAEPSAGAELRQRAVDPDPEQDPALCRCGHNRASHVHEPPGTQMRMVDGMCACEGCDCDGFERA